jgi:hypothetical protein
MADAPDNAGINAIFDWEPCVKMTKEKSQAL